MHGRFWRRVTFALVGVFAAFLTAVVPGGAAGAQDDPANDQQVVRLTGNYEIRPDEGRVLVEEAISVSNVRGNQVSGDTITSFFWTGHPVWAPDDAEGLSISVEGRELEWEVADTIQGTDIISADFFRNLNLGQTQIIDVSYTLPTYGPGEGPRRLNSALFELELLICCNFESIDLTVTVPSDFEVDPAIGLAFQVSRQGSNNVYTFTDDEDTGRYTEILFTQWAGFDATGLESTEAQVGGQPVTIAYPPDDQRWGDETALLASEVGAELETLLGRPMPAGELVLRQGTNREFLSFGVAGPFDEPVVLPRDYSDAALGITLANNWMLGDVFVDDRVREGLAIGIGAGAVENTGRAGIDTLGAPPGTTQAGLASLFSLIIDEVGVEALGELVQMAEANETAYLAPGSAPGSAESVATIPGDWRRFVDLLEFRLDSRPSVDLVANSLLTADEIAQLGDRDRAVDRYETLRGRADGVVPLGIRTAMTNWDFGQADQLMNEAEAVLTDRERIVEALPDRADDEGLALGETWAQAESVDDLAAVGQELTDREDEINRSGRLLIVLIVGGVLLLVLLALAVFLLLRRRRSQHPSSPTGPSHGAFVGQHSASGAPGSPGGGWVPPQQYGTAPGVPGAGPGQAPPTAPWSPPPDQSGASGGPSPVMPAPGIPSPAMPAPGGPPTEAPAPAGPAPAGPPPGQTPTAPAQTPPPPGQTPTAPAQTPPPPTQTPTAPAQTPPADVSATGSQAATVSFQAPTIAVSEAPTVSVPNPKKSDGSGEKPDGGQGNGGPDDGGPGPRSQVDTKTFEGSSNDPNDASDPNDAIDGEAKTEPGDGPGSS